MNSAPKPTLLSFKQRTAVTTQQLAEMAGVSPGDAYAVEIGGFIDSGTAIKVINAFVHLSGVQVRAEDIVLNNAQRRLV